MGVKFIPENIESEIRDLLTFCNNYKIEYDFEHGYVFDEDYDYADEDEDEDIIINDEIEFNLYLPRSDYEECNFTLGEVLEMAREAKNCIKVDEYGFIGKKLALVRIDSFRREVLTRITDENPHVTSLTEIIDDQEYEINIVEGITSYGLALAIEKKYNKYTPPVDYNDMFIEIRAESDLNHDIINSLVQAYMFEIRSTLKVEIHISPRPYYDPWEDDENEIDISSTPLKLRPLLRGKGISELIDLYNSTLPTQNAEILLLTYVKVIEYVSQSVIQKDLIASTLTKLSSRRALSPDATYILELNKIFDNHRNNKKDHQAIKLTIETCCDIHEIVPSAPQFLKVTNRLTLDSKEDVKQKAIEEVASAISQTRNMFAHAKTNYDFKGMECPAEQLHEFAECVDILAQQIIRWFAREHEDNRVV
ncbi:hypothetical protein [Cytobacillus solani]|uniref:Uncharacterized protein n=1 Tax=Cytobacillus solani TaxID=1637975 RepID=A0A0Q3QSV3_9BACI|nr:hypothetical protein [Cytobacillus solani]KQL21233.1 hypothetical protein AN957_23480 [Cytobacillus solani]